MTPNENSLSQLVGIVESIERHEEEIAEGRQMVKDIYEGAKDMGFDATVIRRVIRLRAMTPAQRAALDEKDALIETYTAALDKHGE